MAQRQHPGEQLAMQPCAGAVRSLPRFDAHVLQTYMDDLRDMKAKVRWVLPLFAGRRLCASQPPPLAATMQWASGRMAATAL